MSLEALPYTVLILLAELSVGGMAVLLGLDMRGLVAKSYLKLSAAIVLIGAGLTLLTAFGVDAVDDIDGYPVEASLVNPVRFSFLAFLILLLPYTYFVWREDRPMSARSGLVAALVGIGALFLMAYAFSDPTWGFAAPMLSLLVGSLSVGAVTLAMLLGHWYLVTPRLPSKPLEEITLFLLIVLLVQAGLMILNIALPVREVPQSENALGTTLTQSPAFWLRVAVGLVFPLALAYMAWQSTLVKAMTSATGLLYVAVGAIFAGEVLARGLLFVTAVPV
jgi:hypothetical protein